MFGVSGCRDDLGNIVKDVVGMEWGVGVWGIGVSG